MTSVMTLQRIDMVDQLRLRKFWPVDRDSPIFEAVFRGGVLFDVAREGGKFNVAFHEAITRVAIETDVLEALISRAKAMIAELEDREK